MANCCKCRFRMWSEEDGYPHEDGGRLCRNCWEREFERAAAREANRKYWEEQSDPTLVLPSNDDQPSPEKP